MPKYSQIFTNYLVHNIIIEFTCPADNETLNYLHTFNYLIIDSLSISSKLIHGLYGFI